MPSDVVCLEQISTRSHHFSMGVPAPPTLFRKKKDPEKALKFVPGGVLSYHPCVI